MPGRDDMNFDFLKDVFVRVELDEQEKKQKERADIEKACGGLYTIFSSLIKVGFTREEALELVKIAVGGAAQR